VSSCESRVTGHAVTGQLSDGSRGSRVKKCDPLSPLCHKPQRAISKVMASQWKPTSTTIFICVAALVCRTQFCIEFTLIHDLYCQSTASYGHDSYTRKTSRSAGSKDKVETNGRTNEQTDTTNRIICSASLAGNTEIDVGSFFFTQPNPSHHPSHTFVKCRHQYCRTHIFTRPLFHNYVSSNINGRECLYR